MFNRLLLFVFGRPYMSGVYLTYTDEKITLLRNKRAAMFSLQLS